MLVSKGDFEFWKADHVTKAFHDACMQRVEDAKDILSVQAGQDPDSDNFYRGFIFAYREMVDFKVDDIGGEE